MLSFWEKVGRLWQEFRVRLTWRRENAPIDSVAGLVAFIASRSAFVAQTTLYGYLKTRIGTRYPRFFEDEAFVASIKRARLHVFTACLADLTIFSVAEASKDRQTGNTTQRAIALHCYNAALLEHSGEGPQEFSTAHDLDAFSCRVEETDWAGRARRPENFTDSPRALLKWAPVADELKAFDAEIVQNSIRFAWRDVRDQLRQRINGAAIYADWQRMHAN